MTNKIDYHETTLFQKKFNNLKKKFRTLDSDLKLAKSAIIELYHLRKMNNFSVFLLQGFFKSRDPNL